ncbi:uncharacterized protein LOC117801424 [Ailuropoda melanoleuca]|uniref:uncharacterized protein LOC117801424 n=1 Tax=Ailuropoda melanoleuca TaxID=9646 RepID=UPI0014949E0A|nr:uncharacterized protein LOC117801424 [Ailuropoda melanoleuca]
MVSVEVISDLKLERYSEASYGKTYERANHAESMADAQEGQLDVLAFTYPYDYLGQGEREDALFDETVLQVPELTPSLPDATECLGPRSSLRLLLGPVWPFPRAAPPDRELHHHNGILESREGQGVAVWVEGKKWLQLSRRWLQATDTNTRWNPGQREKGERRAGSRSPRLRPNSEKHQNSPCTPRLPGYLLRSGGKHPFHCGWSSRHSRDGLLFLINAHERATLRLLQVICAPGFQISSGLSPFVTMTHVVGVVLPHVGSEASSPGLKCGFPSHLLFHLL